MGRALRSYPVSALGSALGSLLCAGVDYLGSEDFQTVLKTGVVAGRTGMVSLLKRIKVSSLATQSFFVEIRFIFCIGVSQQSYSYAG